MRRTRAVPNARPSPSDVSPAELAAACAVARRTGRTVFAVCAPADSAPDGAPAAAPEGGRRLSFERPDDPSALAYWVDRAGQVRFGPAGRPPGAGAHAAGASLVRDAASIDAQELAAARDYALLAGRTVFVAAAHGATAAAGDPPPETMRFAPPLDGTLRYAVRVTGELLLGPAAAAERPASIPDAGWTARVGAHLRQLRRLRDRAAELAPLAVVRAQDWARVERLIPPAERLVLRPGAWIGARGPAVAAALLAAADRELERLRREARDLLDDE